MSPFSSASTLSAQEPITTYRSISLRPFDGKGRPITDKNIRIKSDYLIDHYGYRIIHLILPDSSYLINQLPVHVTVYNNADSMNLFLGADVDSILFTPGYFHIPYRYEEFFTMSATSGVEIPERRIENFRAGNRHAIHHWTEPGIRELSLDSATMPRVDNRDATQRELMLFDRDYASIELSSMSGPSATRTILHQEIFGDHKWDGYQILRTTDGGATFSQFEPKLNTTLPEGARKVTNSLFFANREQGWLTVREKNDSSQLMTFETGDGGRSWKESKLMTSKRIVDGGFFDQQFGWFIGFGPRGLGPDTGSDWLSRYLWREELRVYTTADGGRSLTELQPAGGIHPEVKAHRGSFYGVDFPSVLPLNRERILITQFFQNYLEVVRDSETGTFQTITHPGHLVAMEIIDDRHAYKLVLTNNPDSIEQREWFRYDSRPFQTCTLYRTDDGGETWKSLLQGADNCSTIRFYNVDRGVVVAEFGLYITTDRGESWRYLPFAPGDPGYQRSPYEDREFGEQPNAHVGLVSWISSESVRLVSRRGYVDVGVDW